MRQNFGLADKDVIKNIRKQLEDSPLMQQFCGIMPEHDCAPELWVHLVTRTCNLHGTELARQLFENLAAMKRKAAAAKRSHAPSSTSMHAKLEQLRAAKRQKKLVRDREMVLLFT
jgi:hypothetical protein